MKVVAFNGSPRINGNTERLVKIVFSELEKEGIETELVNLRDKKIGGCIACYACFQNKDGRCAIDDDDLNDLIGLMMEADAVILASPTYFANVSTEIKALIDRAGLVSRANDRMLSRKIGAAVVAVRRAGAVSVFNSINQFFFANEMIVPGSSYWNLGVGLLPGDVEEDDEGVETMKTLGGQMAWLLEKTR